MITLTQLEYIVAIDEYRHFATAAEKCFVTQPTLSMQIKKLEDELGVIIFDRSRQPVVPTDLGAKLIEQARMTLSATQRIKEIIQEEQQEVEGTLKIGIIPTLAPYLLPVFIGPYIRKYPAVKVEVEELVSEEIIRRLKRDILDVGLFVTPYHDEKIVERPVFYEEMLVYAHPDCELLKKKEVILQIAIVKHTKIINPFRMRNLYDTDEFTLKKTEVNRTHFSFICSTAHKDVLYNHFVYKGPFSCAFVNVNTFLQIIAHGNTVSYFAAVNDLFDHITKSYKVKDLHIVPFCHGVFASVFRTNIHPCIGGRRRKYACIHNSLAVADIKRNIFLNHISFSFLKFKGENELCLLCCIKLTMI